MWVADRRSVLRLAAVMPLAAWAPRVLANPAEQLVIETTSGRVRGKSADGVRVFTGIPFGQADRFAAPRPAARWRDVLDATKPAKLAPQVPGMVAFPADASEDCLQLNVWAPQGRGPCPVLVYVHGGANETGWGGDASTTGDRFASDGVVCVTMNYRLGALGFMETGALLGLKNRGSCNNAMRDLLLALRWVRTNIAAFGGDPHQVTIAGESAGGKNVGTLLGMPAADGLYRSAAIFSGGAETVHTTAQADAFAGLFARKLGGVDRLRSAPIDALLAAQQEARAAWPQNFPFRPMVDGQLLPAIPLERIRTGAAPRVPLMIGTNVDESRLFLTAADAGRPLAQRMIANDTAEHMASMDRRYAAAFPELSAAERHWRLLTAEEYGMPSLRVAEEHATDGAPVYRYRLNYPAPGGPFKGHTPHVLDVPFTFDHVSVPSFVRFFGLSPADQPTAYRMHGAVVAFVRDSRPSAATLPVWPRFDTASRGTMVIGQHCEVVQDPDQAERLLWLS